MKKHNFDNEVPKVTDNVIAATDIVGKRLQWQKQYSYWLTRKNKFADKLQAANRSTDGSAKYQELNNKVKHYWQLLHDSKPIYTPL